MTRRHSALINTNPSPNHCKGPTPWKEVTRSRNLCMFLQGSRFSNPHLSRQQRISNNNNNNNNSENTLELPHTRIRGQSLEYNSTNNNNNNNNRVWKTITRH